MSSNSYNVFKRTWWREFHEADRRDGFRPGQLVPHMGRKTYLKRGVSWAEAQQICEEFNKTHSPGKYSLKAEFEQA